MRLLATGFALLLAIAGPALAERVVTESAGRTVRLPDRVARVFAAGPPASVLVYVLAPDKLRDRAERLNQHGDRGARGRDQRR